MIYRFMRFHDGKAKAVTLSYDDAVLHDVRLADRLSECGMKCTFNYNNFIDTAGHVSAEQVKEKILGRGHEIALHGAHHRAEGSMRPLEGIKDVLDNRLYLEKMFGIIVRGMAYPDSGIGFFANGADYSSVKQYLTELGVAYARTTLSEQSFMLPSDWLSWNPSAHHSEPKVLEYIDSFLDIDITYGKMYCARRAPRLFYLWGHSYEFENAQNWDLLDKICDKLAGHDDIWYATNMEIHDYTEAYNSLIYSADNSMVYNPSLLTVWFDADGKLFEIKPGETVKLD